MRLIDADAFVKSVVKSGFGVDFINRITALLIDAPIIEPKQGKWIDKGWHGDWQFEIDGRGNCWKVFECSNCNTASKVQTNFCPNCGAKMKGADDETD